MEKTRTPRNALPIKCVLQTLSLSLLMTTIFHGIAITLPVLENVVTMAYSLCQSLLRVSQCCIQGITLEAPKEFSGTDSESETFAVGTIWWVER